MPVQILPSESGSNFSSAQLYDMMKKSWQPLETLGNGQLAIAQQQHEERFKHGEEATHIAAAANLQSNELAARKALAKQESEDRLKNTKDLSDYNDEKSADKELASLQIPITDGMTLRDKLSAIQKYKNGLHFDEAKSNIDRAKNLSESIQSDFASLTAVSADDVQMRKAASVLLNNPVAIKDLNPAQKAGLEAFAHNDQLKPQLSPTEVANQISADYFRPFKGKDTAANKAQAFLQPYVDAIQSQVGKSNPDAQNIITRIQSKVGQLNDAQASVSKAFTDPLLAPVMPTLNEYYKTALLTPPAAPAKLGGIPDTFKPKLGPPNPTPDQLKQSALAVPIPVPQGTPDELNPNVWMRRVDSETAAAQQEKQTKVKSAAVDKLTERKEELEQFLKSGKVRDYGDELGNGYRDMTNQEGAAMSTELQKINQQIESFKTPTQIIPNQKPTTSNNSAAQQLAQLANQLAMQDGIPSEHLKDISSAYHNPQDPGHVFATNMVQHYITQAKQMLSQADDTTDAFRATAPQPDSQAA